MHKLEDKDITLTPLSLIETLGPFDLDPCGLHFHKTANAIISLPLDGLSEKWFGRVWLNPPYSDPSSWMEKLANHGRGTALVLNSTDAKWFHDFGLNRATALLMLKGRPKFTRMDGSRVSIMRGVVLFAYGEEDAFALQTCGLSGKYVRLMEKSHGSQVIF
jgi:hypothetical protein